jgi:hypothetical protein
LEVILANIAASVECKESLLYSAKAVSSNKWKSKENQSVESIDLSFCRSIHSDPIDFLPPLIATAMVATSTAIAVSETFDGTHQVYAGCLSATGRFFSLRALQTNAKKPLVIETYVEQQQRRQPMVCAEHIG